MLCSSSVLYLPHIHWLNYQPDESVVGLKQPPELLTQVEVPRQPDNHDSIQELVDVAQMLMVSNEYVL